MTDPATNRCAIIALVLDYDEKAGRIRTTRVDSILAFAASRGYTLQWILNTHPHADHFTAAGYLKQETGVAISIGEHVCDVQKLWNGIYGFERPADGSQWDRLFADGETFRIGRWRRG